MKVSLNWRDGVYTRLLFNLVTVCCNKWNNLKSITINQCFEREVLLPVEIYPSWFNSLPASKCCLSISRLDGVEELLLIKFITEYINSLQNDFEPWYQTSYK